MSQPIENVCHKGYGKRKLINRHAVAGQHEVPWRDSQSNLSKYGILSWRVVIKVGHLGLVVVLVSVKGHEESWVRCWLMIPLHGKFTLGVCYVCHPHRLNHILLGYILFYILIDLTLDR